MKRFLGSLALVVVLAACGGGSSGGPPIITPTNPPTQTTSVMFAWTGPGHSSGTTTASIMPFDSAVLTAEPLEVAPKASCSLGALGCNSIAANANFDRGTVQATEVTSTGAIVSSTPSSFTVSDTTVASATAVPTPTPAPSSTPGPSLFVVVSQAQNPGQTLVTAMFADGTHGSLPVKVYNFIALQCSGLSQQASDSAQAFQLQNGKLVAINTISGADLYVTGTSSECPSAFGGDTALTVHAPGGMQNIGLTTAIGNATSALPFASSGTSALLSSLSGDGLVVKTAGGNYVLIKWGVTECSWNTTAPSCDAYGFIAGLYKASDAGGNFST